MEKERRYQTMTITQQKNRLKWLISIKTDFSFSHNILLLSLFVLRCHYSLIFSFFLNELTVCISFQKSRPPPSWGSRLGNSADSGEIRNRDLQFQTPRHFPPGYRRPWWSSKIVLTQDPFSGNWGIIRITSPKDLPNSK